MMEVDSGRACPSLSGRMMEVDSGRACPSLSALDGDAGDEEVSELMGEVDGMNGDAEDCRHVVDKLDKTAIIKQDVMLSARDTQSPMTSAFHVSASSGSSSSASSLNDSGFWGASSPESQDISDCIKTDSISSMFSQSNQNFSSQSVTTSLLTTNQNSPTRNDKPSGRSVLPVQQLLIPVSTSNGTQQLISIPLSLAAGSGSPIQLLSTPGGQLIATNLPGLGQPLNLSLPGSQCLAQASQLLKNNNKNILNSINSNLLLARQQNSDKLATITVKPVNKTKPASHIIAVSKQPLNAATVNGIVALTTSARNKITQESDEADSTNSSISGGSPPLGATNSSKFTTQLLVNLASGATTAHRLSNGSALLNGGTVLKTANGVTVSGSRTVSINGIGENGLNGRGSVGIPVTSLHSHLNGGINSSGLHSLGAATIGGVVPSNINQLLPNTISSAKAGTVVDGVNLDEIREFAKQFKIRRLSLGLTQTQVGQALCTTEGPSYSQSAICRFEKLDITPKSAQKIKPVLEKWMSEAEERYQSGLHNMSDYIGSESSKKRKRRTSFTPQALEVLNEYFERNTHPSGADMTKLAETLSYNREVIRIWFCNKRQALKNTVRRLSMPKDVEC